MKLLATKCLSSDKYDRIAFVRDDGTRCEISMPRQGILPHDLIHYVVETGCDLRNGFLSLIAAGADARYVIELAHDPAKRGIAREAIQAEALQAEAIVEALQTQLWAGTLDHDAFLYGMRTASEARGVDTPAIPTPEACNALFRTAIDLNTIWSQIKPHQILELRFHIGTLDAGACNP